MVRLVDADDFKKFLQALCNAGAPYHEVIQLLDKQPTAYDMEKVVEQLKEQSHCTSNCCENCDKCEMFIEESKAIEIVRNGGAIDGK